MGNPVGPKYIRYSNMNPLGEGGQVELWSCRVESRAYWLL